MNDVTPTDVSGIPRYKASMPMQMVFVRNSDSCGDHVFTQISRVGNVAVYRRERVKDGSIAGYETIKISVVKAGTVYADGATPTSTDTESYPGAESFGTKAWSYTHLKSATDKLLSLTKETEPTWNIPNGVFTVIDFARANSLEVNVETAGRLGELLKSRTVKFMGKNERSLQVFSKV